MHVQLGLFDTAYQLSAFFVWAEVRSDTLEKHAEAVEAELKAAREAAEAKLNSLKVSSQQLSTLHQILVGIGNSRVFSFVNFSDKECDSGHREGATMVIVSPWPCPLSTSSWWASC
jgi:hypothetical protein